MEDFIKRYLDETLLFVLTRTPTMELLVSNKCFWPSANALRLVSTLGISTFKAKLKGLPWSLDSAIANSSSLCSILFAAFMRYSALDGTLNDDHPGKAFLAASTARSITSPKISLLNFFI